MQDTIVTQVMQQIKNLIVTGEYKLGNQIPTESELSDALNISRSTVREAIKIFNYLGVLQSRRGAGTFVSESSKVSTEILSWAVLISTQDFMHYLDLREVIEEWCTLSLLNSYTINVESAKATLTKIEKQIHILKTAVENSSLKDKIEADFNIHSTIVEAQGNHVVTAIWHALNGFLHKEIELLEVHSPAEDLVAEHQAIIDGIKSKSKRQTYGAFHSHIDNIRKRIASINRTKE